MPYIAPKMKRQKCFTDKDTTLYQSETLYVAVTSLQGWREEMEDAYCVLLPKNSALDKTTLESRFWRSENRFAMIGDEPTVRPEHGSTPEAETPVDLASTPPPNISVTSYNNSSTAPVFFSQGSGSVRFGTSVDVSPALSTARNIANGSVITSGPPKPGRVTLCGVFDGHGGSEVSTAVAKQMGNWVLNSQSFSKNLYERALHEAFITNDNTMRAEWNRNREGTYNLAGCTANVILIVEEYSHDVTQRIEQVRKAMCSDAAPTSATLLSVATPASPQRLQAPQIVSQVASPAVSRQASSPATRPGTSGHLSPSSEHTTGANNSFALGGLGIAFSTATPDRHQSQGTPLHNNHRRHRHALYDEVKIICANAGDSRSVLVRCNGLVIPMSLDHKPSLAGEKARIVAANGYVSRNAPDDCDRIDGILSVSRGFGDFMFKADNALSQDKQLVIPNPDIRVTNQRKDVEGRYSFPWVGFGERHSYSEALVARLNEGRGVKGDKKAAADRSAAERDLLRLQKCLKWVPTQSSGATSIAGTSTGAGHLPSPQSYANHNHDASHPPSPQAGYQTGKPAAAACKAQHDRNAQPEGIQLPVVLDMGSVSISFADATKPAKGSANVSIAEEDRSDPPPRVYCDPSATSAVLFVAQACDGIWDCLTNNELSIKVLELLDCQLRELIETRLAAAAAPQNAENNDGTQSTIVPFDAHASASLFKGISLHVRPTEITEAIVDYCLQMSFKRPQPKRNLTKPVHADAELKAGTQEVPATTTSKTEEKPATSLADSLTEEDAEPSTTSAGIRFGTSPPIKGPEVERLLAAATASSSSPANEGSFPEASDIADGESDSDEPDTQKVPTEPIGNTQPPAPEHHQAHLPQILVPEPISSPSTSPAVSHSTSPAFAHVKSTPTDGPSSSVVATTQPKRSLSVPRQPPNYVITSPTASSSPANDVYVPRYPLNSQGTDNMTFALIFFKDGIYARAMMVYQQMAAAKSIKSIEV